MIFGLKSLVKKMQRCKNIIVKDYIYPGNYALGSFYVFRENRFGGEEILYILDDGDIFSEKDLQESGYKYIFISSNDIINTFKKRFKDE